MNQVIECLKSRASVRAFSEEKIPRHIKEVILNMAMAAPTAGNQQLYTIIEVNDQEKKDILAESCDHQPFIAQAPWVLLFCADQFKWYEAYKLANLCPREPGPGDFLLAVEDTMIAAQNAVIAAQSLGIGSCYIGDILEHKEVHQKMFNLPKIVVPVSLLVFGYPKSRAEAPKNRFPLNCVVYEDNYRSLSRKEWENMTEFRRRGSDFDSWMKAFFERKYQSDFSEEMNRSVNEYLKGFMDKL